MQVFDIKYFQNGKVSKRFILKKRFQKNIVFHPPNIPRSTGGGNQWGVFIREKNLHWFPPVFDVEYRDGTRDGGK